jgi:hypothetical protein
MVGEWTERQAHNKWVKTITRNLLAEIPPGVDLYELRELLGLRIGGPGQYDDGDSKRRLYLPLARAECRLVLVYKKNSATLQRIEPGAAFEEAQWQQIITEAQDSLLSGSMKFGRDYCLAGRRVLGSWRGRKSGIQILPPLADVPIAPVEMVQHPFVLECPLQTTREWRLTNYRRRRLIRVTAMLLNVLLDTSIRPHWTVQSDHLWVSVPGVDTRRFKFDRLRRWLHLPKRPPPPSRIEWGQEFFYAPLDQLVIDEQSPPAKRAIPEFESDRPMGDPERPIEELYVPHDLDESLCAYAQLREEHRERLNRSLYWFQLASRFGYRHMAASFLAMVSAIEALIETHSGHDALCSVCGEAFLHRVPGPTKAFRTLLARYVPGPQFDSRRNEMYALRSGLVHGTALMELDDERYSVWDPAQHQQTELWTELFGITRIAIRNWLNDPNWADTAATDSVADS